LKMPDWKDSLAVCISEI